MRSTLAILAFLSFVSSASAADGDGRKEAEANVASQLAQLKTKCGAKNLAIKINWEAYGKLKPYAEEVELSLNDLMRNASAHVGQVTSALLDLCKDADFKAEIAKLTQLTYTPIKAEQRPATIKKTGTTIQFQTDAYKFDPTSTTADELSKIF